MACRSRIVIAICDCFEVIRETFLEICIHSGIWQYLSLIANAKGVGQPLSRVYNDPEIRCTHLRWSKEKLRDLNPHGVQHAGKM